MPVTSTVPLPRCRRASDGRRRARAAGSYVLFSVLLLAAWGCARPAAAPAAAARSATEVPAAGSAAAGGAQSPAGPAPTTQVIIAEPNHGLSYLPLYVAIRQGHMAEEGLQVEPITLTGGSAHTNAVLTGQGWGFIGGPEHNAYAKLKGASLKALVSVVNRGNGYIAARPGMAPDADLAEFFRGKRIATGQVGSTPHSITRYVLQKAGLDPARDVTLLELESTAIVSAIQRGAADVVYTSEPQLSRGIGMGLWGEPFYSVPRELGPFANSTINVRADTVERDAGTAERFVRGMLRGLRTVEQNHDLAHAVATQEFPTMEDSDVRAMLDRYYADEMWRTDGEISRESVATSLVVVTGAGLLKEPVAYDEIVDTSVLARVR